MLIRVIGARESDVVQRFAAVASRRDPNRYCSGWGRPGDLGVVATEGTTAVGAAWSRLFDGAPPPADPDIPELAIAVTAGHRGKGVGHALLSGLIAVLAEHGHRYVDLSVAAGNASARRLYERVGFTEVERAADGRSWMRRPLI